MNKKNWIIILLFFCLKIYAIEIYPQNIFLDHYEIIPPLGKIKSIATSMNKIFVISDNYLLFFDKNTLELIRTTYFSQDISLVAYDPFYDELWISSVNSIVRYNISSGSVREYHFNNFVKSIGLTSDKVYILSQKKIALDRVTGKFEIVPEFPENTVWYNIFEKKLLDNYRFLSPFFYQDDLNETNDPFYQYEITALYQDGIYLYVGTNKYGILRYNTVSLVRDRIIYGPLSTYNVKLKKFNDKYYFISEAGISSLSSDGKNLWSYFRLSKKPGDFLSIGNEYIISFGSQLTKISGAVSLPITQFGNNIITLNFDQTSIYVGTVDGMYKILRETREPIEFGPDRYPIYVIYPSDEQIFVGGEFATYRFDQRLNQWFQIMPWGAKDICEVKSNFYFLTVDNQLIRYKPLGDSILVDNDTNVILLPYFNIYDIDSDGKILYCATGSGINYFDPETQLYNPIYNLPRIKYNNVAVVNEDIIAISDNCIYRLPIKYHD
ncbi:MAG: hypothetical protein ABIL46_00750 [candidate division WOR-3 bacterium]